MVESLLYFEMEFESNSISGVWIKTRCLMHAQRLVHHAARTRAMPSGRFVEAGLAVRRQCLFSHSMVIPVAIASDVWWRDKSDLRVSRFFKIKQRKPFPWICEVDDLKGRGKGKKQDGVGVRGRRCLKLIIYTWENGLKEHDKALC